MPWWNSENLDYKVLGDGDEPMNIDISRSIFIAMIVGFPLWAWAGSTAAILAAKWGWWSWLWLPGAHSKAAVSATMKKTAVHLWDEADEHIFVVGTHKAGSQLLRNTYPHGSMEPSCRFAKLTHCWSGCDDCGPCGDGGVSILLSPPGSRTHKPHWVRCS